MDKIKKIRDPRIHTDPDFIISPKYGNSMKRMLDENPNGVSNAVICKSLGLEKEELNSIYESAMLKLRKAMQADYDDSI